MRMPFIMVALLPVGSVAIAADESTRTPAPVASQEVIVVTATREPSDVLAAPASIARIDGDALALLGAKHQADALNQIAGVYIQRGSGSESLGGIRSPVLTGAGGCGAFLIAED